MASPIRAGTGSAWPVRPVGLWMALRDRRAPFAAVVLLAAYGGLATGLVLAAGTAAGYPPQGPSTPWRGVPAQLCLLGLGWRLAARFACTAHEYGWTEGIRAVLRAPLANVIAIAAANRALLAYLRTLRGGSVRARTRRRTAIILRTRIARGDRRTGAARPARRRARGHPAGLDRGRDDRPERRTDQPAGARPLAARRTRAGCRAGGQRDRGPSGVGRQDR